MFLGAIILVLTSSLAALTTATNSGIIFKLKSWVRIDSEERAQENEVMSMETYLWMSEFPSKTRLCTENRCKALSCKLYKLPADDGWPSDVYYEVTSKKFNKLKRWCDWEGRYDTKRKGIASTLRNTMQSMMIFPGTRWCGFGNRANHFEDLGRYSNEDTCCREHDMCPVFIPAGSCVQNKMADNLCNNSTITMSHCDCDVRFQQCLQRLNSATASIIADLYFNLLGGRCFARAGHYGEFHKFVLKTPPANWGRELYNMAASYLTSKLTKKVK